ncbi:MAG TPA: GAF and ANTAR domain-containing protein, partial [Micromonosporaceae bacterium]
RNLSPHPCADYSNPGSTGEDGRVSFDSQPHLVEIVAALKEITARITAAQALPEAVDDLLKVTGDLLPGHVQCGVTLISQGEPATFAATTLPAEVLDEVRHADGEGPVLEAIRTRDVVLSQDLATEDRWPVWCGRARRHGVHGVLSYPFDVDTLTLGALNLYADRPEAFVDEVPIIAMLVADHASLLLRMRLRQFIQDELLVKAETGTGDVTVERAIGIIMAQRGCAPDQALRHLHDAATHLGVSVAAVADRLVRTVSDRRGAVAD